MSTEFENLYKSLSGKDLDENGVQQFLEILRSQASMSKHILAEHSHDSNVLDILRKNPEMVVAIMRFMDEK